MHPADLAAFERLVATQPAWTGMRVAREATALSGKFLLHCGPPVRHPAELVVPTRNSAAVACVFEGWAASLKDAHELLGSGEISCLPAQDHAVATPMAAVVSPSMPLIEMRDSAASGSKAYAPINGGGTGGDPAPRYGRCSLAALDYLRFLNGPVAEVLASLSGAPIPWLALIDRALTEGDDGHLRHKAAHARLVELIERRAPAIPPDVLQFVHKWPFFHLNFWMAAVRCALTAAEGVPASSLVTAFAGNGTDFGLKLSHAPSSWHTVAATPPRGKVRAPFTETSGVGAYGDSAVVEAFGLGAMAFTFAPDMHTLHEGFTPDDIRELPAKLLCGPHPALSLSGARAGLCARRVLEAGVTPIVELGIVDKAGKAGGLGAGLYRPPITLFERACAKLPA